MHSAGMHEAGDAPMTADRDAPARRAPPAADRTAEDAAFQAEMLQGVARSFALTTAQLPPALRGAGANVYLLCRIADTIEDDPALSPAQKEAFSERWVEVVSGGGSAAAFARDLGARLSAATAAERRLIADAERVVAINHRLRAPQRRAIERCVRIMTRGMVEFQHRATPDGLADIAHLDRYCYHVAGVVGETLTELYCDYSAAIARRREELLRLSVPFGQGLQMINVLKDMWEDKRRGVCWLPQDVFRDAGIDDLRTLRPGHADPSFVRGLTTLVAITRRRLADALRYVQILPARETGIRRSCLWPLGLAVLTLKRIHAAPAFTTGRQVKVPRRTVWAVAGTTALLARSNPALRLLFAGLTRGLPRPAPSP